MSGNVFIVLVHCLDWLKTQSINTIALIINSIGCCSISLQGIMIVNEILFFLFNDFYSQDWVIRSFIVVLTSLSFSSLCFSTCLCFYYCVKITNLNAAFFQQLKTKISTIVPGILVVSVAISWAAGLASYWDLNIQDYSTMATNSSGNKTFGYNLVSRCDCLIIMYMVIAGIAFTIIFTAVVSIITSLCKHMERMKKNSEGFGKSSLDFHRAAAKTVTSLLIIYMIFYGALNLMFNDTAGVGSWLFSLSIIVISGFPSVNAFVLIMGNRKLKNVLKKLFGVNGSSNNTEESVANS
ncbi:taste receptor type 2 member 9-like [Discoglossus pictus]